MIRSKAKVAAAVAALLLTVSGGASAQGVWFRALGGQLGAEFRGTVTHAQQSNTTRLGYFWEWMDIRMFGAVLHPRVFSVRAQLRPTWLQGYSDVGLETASDAGRIVNYNVVASVLSGLPVFLTGRASRTTGTELAVLSAPRDYDLGEVGVRLDVRNSALPIYADFRRESRSESWYPQDSPLLLRDEMLETLEVRARNSKISALLERRDLTDRSDGRDFQSWRGTLTHRLRWGKRSSLSSHLVYVDRTGFMPQEELAWAEHLHLQHTWDFGTDLRYGQTRRVSGGSRTDARDAEAVFTYSPSRFFQASTEGYARWSEYQLGTREEYRVRPSAGLVARLPGGAVLNASASIGFESISQTATNGNVPVINEVHVIGASRRLSLFERFADPATVVVTDVAETIAYAPEFDYRVLETGAGVELVILPQGRIMVGDTVLVDYEYRIVPDARAQGPVMSLGLNLDAFGFRAYVRRDVRELDDRGPQPLGLAQDFWRVGLGYRATVGALQADVLGEYDRQEYVGIETSTYLLSASLASNLGPALRASVAGSGYWKRGGLVPYENVQANLSLEWVPSGVLRLGARGVVWWWEEDDVRVESSVGVGANADVRLRLLTLRVAYDRGWWNDGTERSTDRLLVRLTRDF